MSTNRWVYRIADGQFLFGNGPDPSIYLTDQVNYGIADIGDGTPLPNERTQKWNGTAVVAKTAPEIAAFDAAVLAARSQLTSRNKDILSMCALIVRSRGIPAWNGMTIQQKVDATLAEADVWKTIRDFIDDKAV